MIQIKMVETGNHRLILPHLQYTKYYLGGAKLIEFGWWKWCWIVWSEK